MKHLTSHNVIVCLNILLSVCGVSVFAQSDSPVSESHRLQWAPVNTVYFRDIALYSGQYPNRPVDVRVTGSIKGRIFNDADLNMLTRSVDSPGISGVRVILRSADSEEIAGHQISGTDGTYDFPSLQPGKYSVELDPLSIPGKFRKSDVKLPPVTVEPSHGYDVDLPLAARRTITGIVFEDKDGDGQYTAGKDRPIEGALITVNGNLSRSNESGRYILQDLPAGRIGVLVRWPHGNENTHVVLNLDPGPVTNRIVNVPHSR